MNSNQITCRQVQAIKVRVEDVRDYLHRLRVRMANRGFPPDDPLYVLVVEAQQPIGESYLDCCNRAYGGPTSTPSENKTAWLGQRSARGLELSYRLAPRCWSRERFYGQQLLHSPLNLVENPPKLVFC